MFLPIIEGTPLIARQPVDFAFVVVTRGLFSEENGLNWLLFVLSLAAVSVIALLHALPMKEKDEQAHPVWKKIRPGAAVAFWLVGVVASSANHCSNLGSKQDSRQALQECQRAREQSERAEARTGRQLDGVDSKLAELLPVCRGAVTAEQLEKAMIVLSDTRREAVKAKLAAEPDWPKGSRRLQVYVASREGHARDKLSQLRLTLAEAGRSDLTKHVAPAPIPKPDKAGHLWVVAMTETNREAIPRFCDWLRDKVGWDSGMQSCEELPD